MHFNDRFRGRLFDIVASLFFFLCGEILKWQFPLHAASEKSANLSAALAFRFLSSCRTLDHPLTNQHAVAVAVKTVPRFDRMMICRHDILFSRECRYQRQ